MSAEKKWWQETELRFTEPLKLSRRPVAVTFLDSAPIGIKRFTGTEPSGCSFWRLAADGRSFYTVPSDHFNCGVGSYTHNIPIGPEREKEATDTLQMMFNIGYILPQEVPGIPRLAQTPAAIAYAPLGEAPLSPSTVIFSLKPSAAMLLNEAAMRAGSGGALPPLGRPACMALPASLEKGTVSSLGCRGSREYTGVGDDELFTVVPGKHLLEVANALETIVMANVAIGDFARGRRAQLSTI